jgi:hypothetical protein
MFGTLSSCILVVFLNSADQVPKKPDFSGEWVLVRASGSTTEQAAEISVRQTITRTTIRGEPMKPWFSELSVVRYSRHSTGSDSYKIGLIGGTVSSGAPPALREQRTSVAVTWRGDDLIIQTGTYDGPAQDPGPYTEHEEVWSLDPEGKLLITVRDRGSNIKKTTVQLVYRRQKG